MVTSSFHSANLLPMVVQFPLFVLAIVALNYYYSLFLVQYTVHLYGYFKTWRKNPQWSLSCCLALLLPLIDMAGDVSGLAKTDVVNTQLDTGHGEVTDITGAVQESGVIEVTLDGSCRMMAQDDGRQIQNASAVKGCAIDVSFHDGERGEVSISEGTGHGAEENNKKCSQGTQTELSSVFPFPDAVEGEPVKEIACTSL